MWSPLLEPRLTLLSGTRRDLRGFCHELAHHAVHTGAGAVLWLDGDHGCNPYEHAERNLARGHPAEEGERRVLVRRCMTPFQWDAAIRRHLPRKLSETQAALVLVAPFDAQFSTDETQDWEQEHLVAAALRSLLATVRRHRVPVLLAADVAKWWRTHPALAALTVQGAESKWHVTHPGRWRVEGAGGRVLDAGLVRQRTLTEFLPPSSDLPSSDLPPLPRFAQPVPPLVPPPVLPPAPPPPSVLPTVPPLVVSAHPRARRQERAIG